MKTKSQGKGFKNNKLLVGLIILLVAALFVVSLIGFQKLFKTETYYVLNEDVATRTQVTPEMLTAVETSDGTAPQNTIGLSEVQTGTVYTQYPLKKGDTLTESNVGGLEDISTGIPDNWVVTSFGVGADNAVGGRISRGTYFDIMVTGDNGSFYPFVNVLALDTTVDLSNASSSKAADTDEAHAGQTTQYVVGMSPEDAAKLQYVMKKYSGSVKLVLSPRQNEYNKPELSKYSGSFSFNDGDDPTWPGKSDTGEVTDSTFKDVHRDKFGKPDQKENDCSQGNAKVTGSDCTAK